MLKIFTAIIVFFILILAVISWWGGQFDRIEVRKETVGPYHLVYREYRGPYSGFRFLSNNVTLFLKEKKNNTTGLGFALFYNAPFDARVKKFEYSAGVVVDTVVEIEAPFKYAEFLATEAIVGTFPIRSYFSYVTGSIKMRKAVSKYCKREFCTVIEPMLELYDLSSKEIRYIAPVGRTTSPAPKFEM